MVDRKLQFQQAKQLDIVAFINQYLPIKFDRQKGHEYWYFSPFVGYQKTSSMQVNANKKVFHCFATGEKGDLSELVAKINDCSLYDALDFIFAHEISPNEQSFSFCGSATVKQETQLKSIKEVGNNKALIEYLETRKIPLDIAKKYLSEIYYFVGEKHYFGLGFKNNVGAYEIRSKYSKICLGDKEITTIDSGFENWAVFEGFFDFLTALIYWRSKDKIFQSNALILNSVSLVDRALIFLNERKVKKVFAFLDSDEPGELCLEKLRVKFDVSDCSNIYTGYKDFNEFWVNQF